MDLSPNDIRSYEFPNQMRGYDKDEVDNFLEQVAAAMEAVKQDNLKLTMEVDSLKSQLAALRQFEETIKNAAIDARRNYDTSLIKAKEEAAEILARGKKQAEDLINMREQRVADIENQLRQLETTRKSYINRFRALVESHQDIINEIAEQDFPELPATLTSDDTASAIVKPAATYRDKLEVTDSSELHGERKEALHQAPSKAASKLEEANAPHVAAKPGAVDDASGLDPELAAALKSYQQEYGLAKPKQQEDDDETTIPPQAQSTDPDKWQETSSRAEDIPQGFVARPQVHELTDEETIATGRVQVSPDSQDRPTEHNAIDMEDASHRKPKAPGSDIAKELDEVVAKFEEEMDKASKS